MSDNQEVNQTTEINTSGGAAIQGNAESGGDIIGRDQIQKSESVSNSNVVIHQHFYSPTLPNPPKSIGPTEETTPELLKKPTDNPSHSLLKNAKQPSKKVINYKKSLPEPDRSGEMARQHTFIDSEFHNADYDPDDAGDFDPNLVFVLMPLSGDDMRDTYGAIKDECKKLRLNARRIDENVGAGFIIREIIDLIERAEFLIFDLTYERPNVYYELGYAHGVGNEADDILLIAKEGTILHFDIAPLRVQYYRSTEHLRSIIATSLKAMIKATR